MVGRIDNGYLSMIRYYPKPNVYGSRQSTVQPVEPVDPVRGVSRRETVAPAVMPKAQLPEIRQGADPVEMAVRGRIQYLSEDEVGKLSRGEALAGPESADGEKTAAVGESKSAQEVMEEGKCQTCENRRYQDGSNDPGVSFKTPTKMDPDRAATEVRGHEMEHVVRNQAKAEREDRKIVSQSVTLHNDICPECGRVYVSGGTTRTSTKADPDNQLQDQLTKQAKKVFGLDQAA